MEFPQIPYNGDNIVQTLVIRHNNKRNVGGNQVPVPERITRTKQVRAFKQREIQVVDTFLMRLIAQYIETNPLNRVKKHKTETKTQIINCRNRI